MKCWLAVFTLNPFDKSFTKGLLKGLFAGSEWTIFFAFLPMSDSSSSKESFSAAFRVWSLWILDGSGLCNPSSSDAYIFWCLSLPLIFRYYFIYWVLWDHNFLKKISGKSKLQKITLIQSIANLAQFLHTLSLETFFDSKNLGPS